MDYPARSLVTVLTELPSFDLLQLK